MADTSKLLVFAAAVALISLHLGAYVVAFRHRRSFRNNSTVLSYHVSFAVGMGLLLGTWMALDPAGALPTVIGVTALIGLYSLSFLELWALADGGYSIAILRRLSQLGEAAEDDCVACFVRLGRAKQLQRQESIIRMGLIRRSGDRLEITPRGRIAAAAAGVLLRLSGTVERG
jgi:hypothetical protein